MILQPGELKPLSVETLPAETHGRIGAVLLQQLRDYYAEGTHKPNETFRKELLAAELAGETKEWFMDMQQVYRSLLSASGVEFSHTRSWLIHAQLSHITWHVDRPGDVRFLLNVGEPTYVEIGDEWDPSAYTLGEMNTVAPNSYGRLGLETGDVYAGNSLVTDQALLQPHQIPPQPNRIIVKSCFYAADGWQDLAQAGGVPITFQ